MATHVLYDFPRSSASYRVRIALALKNIAYEKRMIDLRTGDQRSEDYRAVAPAGLVPALVLADGTTLTQSLAILRFLDVIAEPRLFPLDPLGDARVSAMALTIACDIHPLNNLRVLGWLEDEIGADKHARSRWYAHWVRTGLATLAAEVALYGGEYCYGDAVSAADICLVPQLANARRFEVDLAGFDQLLAIDKRLTTLQPFAVSAP